MNHLYAATGIGFTIERKLMWKVYDILPILSMESMFVHRVFRVGIYILKAVEVVPMVSSHPRASVPHITE